ncbi:MAG: hypothetical protein HC880_21955 [Bacteroidia bacterium]|nr:hypothetical protein [Bacteroidia bacterium]
MEDKEHQAFMNRYETFKNEVGESENAAWEKLNEAMFFEKNLFLLDALNSYQEALDIEPENGAYWAAYNQFIVRHRFGNHQQIQNAE